MTRRERAETRKRDTARTFDAITKIENAGPTLLPVRMKDPEHSDSILGTNIVLSGVWMIYDTFLVCFLAQSILGLDQLAEFHDWIIFGNGVSSELDFPFFIAEPI